VDSASLLCREYPELAASAQAVLEDTVLGILAHESVSKNKPDLVLAGGVFSNVRLNEKVASSASINRCFIYPNMGDGGLSVGGIYKYLSDTKELHPSEFQYFDPYVGPKIQIEDLKEHRQLVSQHFSSFELWVEQIVSHLTAGAVIGLIQGNAEFGPRALMNRSIIATPSDKSLNQSLNSRLKRTEFMPFAPVVRVENFSNVFSIDKFQDSTPFMFMTMTCPVRSEWVDKLAAVVHVDGTARPQVVTYQSNPVAWEILKSYEERTGIPCLINTSFNVHEEPIINSAQHVFDALDGNMVDLVATPHLLLFKK
jgi:carbamoyltransferase